MAATLGASVRTTRYRGPGRSLILARWVVSWARALPIVLLATSLAVTSPLVAHAETSTQCAAGTDTAALNNFIANEVADLVGFDTTTGHRPARWPLPVDCSRRRSSPPPRASRSSSLRPPTGFAHNALVVQDGNCFTTLARARHPGRALRRRRRVVRRGRDDGDVQPLVLADEWRPRSSRPARRSSTSRWPTSSAPARPHRRIPSRCGWPDSTAATFDLVSFAPAPAADQ